MVHDLKGAEPSLEVDKAVQGGRLPAGAEVRGSKPHAAVEGGDDGHRWVRGRFRRVEFLAPPWDRSGR